MMGWGVVDIIIKSCAKTHINIDEWKKVFDFIDRLWFQPHVQEACKPAKFAGSISLSGDGGRDIISYWV